MTSRRTEREPMMAEAALTQLGATVGRLLDPRVFAALQTSVSRRDANPRSYGLTLRSFSRRR